MGNSLALCNSCAVDIPSTIETHAREIEKLDSEIQRIRVRLHDISNIVNNNLLEVHTTISEIKIQLATIVSELQHIRHEVDNPQN